MSDQQVLPMQVAMLGTDTILAAGPVEPVQLWRACQSIGFDLVVPVSWGEELIATSLARQVAGTTNRAAVIATCPRVDDRLQTTNLQAPIIRTVSPPVACARYVRAAFQPRPVHVTYVGACRGASSPEVDAHLRPEMLFARFIDAGVDAITQPKHFDGQVPPERARYASLPGGAPAPDWLVLQGVRLIEAAPITADTVAAATPGSGPVLIDLAASCFCECARQRSASARLEPPRTFVRVVMNLGVSVSDTDVAPSVAEVVTVRSMPQVPQRATFAENGLSAGEGIPAPDLVSTEALTSTLEPW
jgi:hypothetical protein